MNLKNHLNQKIRNKNNKKCILSKKDIVKKKKKMICFACKDGGRLHEKKQNNKFDNKRKIFY